MTQGTSAEPSAKPKVCPTCGDDYEADVLFCPRDGTPIPSKKLSSFRTAEDPYLGLDLAGQIRLKQLIGVGAMGRVYKGFQAGTERDVAVKILHRELSANKELAKRFHQEAKVASRLVQPNVVQVLMTGTVPVLPELRIGGEAYLVMEYLDGISLMTALAASEGSLALPRALRILLQVCDAVGEAHVQGIVHRDLKPENVMLVRRGPEQDYVKVLDFGIARLDWTDRSISTQQGLIFGTAKYISPEGAEGRTVGPPADVYSLATVLYECLSGRAPFEGDSPVVLLVAQTQAAPPELRSIPRASYVPMPIAELVMKNLAKDPAERAQDAHAFGRELVLAIRASGLDPDELLSPSSMLGRQGSLVRIASKERTRALDLRGDEDRESIPPARVSQAPTPAPRPSMHSAPPAGERLLAPTRMEMPVFEPADESGPHPALANRDQQPATLYDDPMFPPEEPVPAAAPRPAGSVRILGYGVVAALVAAALVVLGVRFVSSSSGGKTTEGDSMREAVRRRAWVAPAGQSVRDIVKRSGSQPEVAEQRETATALVIAEALGRKYAGTPAEARELCKLALELSPGNATAQRLLAEVEAAQPAATQQVVSPSLAVAPGPAGRPADGVDHPKGPRAPKAPQTGGPAASASAPPKRDPPPGGSTTAAPPPPPASTPPPPPPSATGNGPWL